MFYKIPNYEFSKNPIEISPIETVTAINNKQDLNIHAKIYDDKECIMFGDIDYTTSREDVINILKDIADETNISLNSFKITLSNKNEFITCHWTVPSVKSNIQQLKSLFSQPRFKRFVHIDSNNRSHSQCDSGIYKNGWLRMPYQTTKNKESIHEIITNDATAEDFLFHIIPESAVNLKWSEPKQEKQKPKQEKKINKSVLEDIERMASKLGNYFSDYEMWVKLGMIIYYETDGSTEGLNLYDRLSQDIDGYKNKDDVSKKYYSIRKSSRPLTIASLYKWFYEEYPEEKQNKSSEYEEYKNDFEKSVFKLNNPVCFGITNDNDLQLVNLTDLKIWAKGKYPKLNVYEEGKNKKVDFVDMWLDDKDNRTLNKIVFNPNMATVNNKEYNLYKGSIYSKGPSISEDECVFLELLKYISNDTQTYEFFIEWISHIVKTPWKKTNTAIVLYSEVGGIGKNCITDGLCELFKNYSAHIESIDDLTKNFNSHFTNKLFIYGDEINANAKKIADKLKQVITRPTQNLEKKGFNAIEINDYSNYIFTTNNENCFKIEKEDRRYLMVRCPDVPLSKDFYTKFYNFIKDEKEMNKLYNFFLNYNTNKYNIGTGRGIMTQYKKELIFENVPAYIEMFYKTPYRFSQRCITSNELFNIFTEYAKKNFQSTNCTVTRFGIEMKKLLQPFVKRSNGTKYDLENISTLEFKKHLYNQNKDYYKYINNLDDEPTFEEDIDE